VTVRFKPVAGKVDRAAGIAIRLTDPDNYYIARANALEDNVRFYRVVKGDRRQIQGVSLKIPSDIWQVLGLRAEGDKFTVMLNGKELFTSTDRTFTGPGRVALWTKADSVTHFDQMVISRLHSQSTRNQSALGLGQQPGDSAAALFVVDHGFGSALFQAGPAGRDR
jgi:uncharacterized protein YneR